VQAFLDFDDNYELNDIAEEMNPYAAELDIPVIPIPSA